MVRGEGRAIQVARAFFRAATKLSDDTEDILPQVTMNPKGMDRTIKIGDSKNEF
jgi:hypothetical protein